MDDAGKIDVASLTEIVEDRLAAVSLKQPPVVARS